MTSPLQEYRKSTYDRTIERLRQEQEQKKTWIDEKLSKPPKSKALATL